MDRAEVGTKIYSTGVSRHSFDEATIVGLEIIKDVGEVVSRIKIKSIDGSPRSVSSNVFFEHYTDKKKFFEVGGTYVGDTGNTTPEYKVIKLLYNDNPSKYTTAQQALAKSTHENGTSSYIILDEGNFKYMVRV
jgi:hypothetical protein